MDLISVEERAVLGVEFGVVPGVAAFGGHRAVAHTPVAPCPVAGDGADPCVAGGSGEEVRARLQVLRHEATIAGTSATDLLRIDEGVRSDKGLHRTDDIVGGLRAPSVQVVSSEALSVAHGTAWVQRIGYIALSGEHRQVVRRLQLAAQRDRPTVVVDDHRVLLRGVEVGGQVVPAIDIDTVGRAVDEVLRRGELHATELLCRDVPDELALARSIEAVEAVGIVQALAEVVEGIAVRGDTEATDDVFLRVDLRDLIRLDVEAVEALAAAVVSEDVEGLALSVVLDVVYAGIEVARQGRDTARGDIDAEELVLIAVAHASVGERIAHAAEAIGRAHSQHVLCARDEAYATDLKLLCEDRIDTARGRRVAQYCRLVEGAVLPVLRVET